MPAARLAEQERLRPQSLSRLITRLVREGLIKRSPGEVDRRTLRLEITAAGRRALSRDMVARRAWLDATMARVLTLADRALLTEAAELMLRLADDGSAQQPEADDDE
jgi:DNA-binding MarR family transcriptional regulator